MSWTRLNTQRLAAHHGGLDLEAFQARRREETPATNRGECVVEPLKTLTDRGDDGPGEEEGAADVPVAGVVGRVFERTHP